ncbi:hypothetical protein [Saccharopolyspora pogona]|uniref:hypothetical protein n=1 Tax=Saccharopolyspora pogona TaxID=333966 RepID=UPI001686FB02|nr:hypothetical protein [Saccharopolyspora pogona]
MTLCRARSPSSSPRSCSCWSCCREPAFQPLATSAHSRPWILENSELLEPLQTSYAGILSGRKNAQTALDETAQTYWDAP